MSDERGFLTATDRAFLRGEKEYEAKQSRYQRREAIAARARAAFEDFALLYEVFDEHERNRVFDVEPEHAPEPLPGEGLYGDLVDSIAFLYLALEGDLHSPVTANRWFSIPFDRVVQQGIKKGESDRYGRRVVVEVDGPDVDVKTNLDGGMVDAAIDKLARQSYNELTESEMYAVLFRFGEIHGDESYSRLADRVEERREELGIDAADPMDIETLFSASDDVDSEGDVDQSDGG
jgi:hypothetical protein